LLSDLAFKCPEWGYAVTVVASRQQYDDASVYLPETETVNGVDIVRVNTSHFGRHGGARALDYVSFIREARRKLKGLVDDRTIVVAKTDPPMLGVFVEPVVRACKGTLVNWLQDLFPETLAAMSGAWVTRRATAPLRFLRNRNLRRAALNVVIGNGMRDYVTALGVPEEKVRVIHNWPLDASVTHKPAVNDFKREWNLAGKFVVGYFGNLGRVHEYQTVLGTMQEMAGEDDVRFLFVGGGYLLEKLKAEVEARGLPNFVQRGYVPREDLAAALQAADAHLVILKPELERFVVPSKFAGVVAAGKPVLYVGDRDGEIGKVVRGEHCGYVVRPGDSTKLADRIRILSRDTGTVAAMRDNSAAVFRSRYRSGALLEQWRHALDEVARAGTQPG
jgi:colanic acid biosynthesis glycosyl transferase WcaI